MKDLQFLSFTVSPIALALYAVISVCALLVFQRLGRQWRRPGFAAAVRARESLALAVVTVSALALVAFGDALRRDQAAEAMALERLNEKAELAAQIQLRIAKELDGARALLAERTVQKIGDEKLQEARNELARFAAFKDPKIDRMIELLDKELEIRKLVAQSLSETEPAVLLPIYNRLSALVPDNAYYKEQASRVGALAAAPEKK